MFSPGFGHTRVNLEVEVGREGGGGGGGGGWLPSRLSRLHGPTNGLSASGLLRSVCQKQGGGEEVLVLTPSS